MGIEVVQDHYDLFGLWIVLVDQDANGVDPGHHRASLSRALTVTADSWAPLQQAYDWIHRAAHLLENPEAQPEAPTPANQPGQLSPDAVHKLIVVGNYKSGNSKKGERVNLRVDDDVVDVKGNVLVRKGLRRLER